MSFSYDSITQHRLLCCNVECVEVQTTQSFFSMSNRCCGMLRPRAQPCLQLLIFLSRVCGSLLPLSMDDAWLQWCADCLRLCDDWLFPPLRWMTVYFLGTMLVCSECLAFFATRPPDWPLCGWWVGKSCQSSGVNHYLCTVSWFKAQSWKWAVSDLQC
jgi:hypothetical protein